MESLTPNDAMWELHAHPVGEGRLAAGLAVGFGVARVRLQSEHEGEDMNTDCRAELLMLVDEHARGEARRGHAKR